MRADGEVEAGVAPATSFPDEAVEDFMVMVVWGSD